MIHKDWFELVKKYSFIDDIIVNEYKIQILYHVGDKKKEKTLPRRTSTTRLKKVLTQIHNETGATSYARKQPEIYT